MRKIDLRHRKFSIKSRLTKLFLMILATVVSINFIVKAAVPGSGTIIATGPNVTWTGNLTGTPPAGNGEPTCVETTAGTIGNCDDFTITVGGTPADWVGKRLRIRFTWTLVSTDYDMAVYKESNGTPGLQGDGAMPAATLDDIVGTSGRGTTTEEEFFLSPADTGVGVYYVRAIYFAAGPGDQYMGSATPVSVSNNLPTESCALPTFDNYQPPVGYPRRDGSAEPSIGVNWNTGNVLTMSRLRCNRTTFNDITSPADPTTGATWFSQTSPAIVTGLDPILFTDSITGRTICGELAGAGGGTNGVISDDDLSTVAATFQSGGPTQGIDHQTIGGGPPNPNIANRQPTTGYPHLFYYASQQSAYGSVATSFDGGLTYQPAVPAYTLLQCGGLHGHIKVAPDGTVYLPNKGCGGKVGLVVSEDNGLNWSLRTIPTSTTGENDPSVGIASSGRLYVGYTSSDNHPHMVISDDKGLTWRDDTDLASAISPNLRAVVFPQVVAGDHNRAALFFLGTSSTDANNPVGNDNGGNGPNFAGTWYPYIATTCDGGKSWSVVRADNDPLHPGMLNPAQQGVICTDGTTCPGGPPDTRNLADFNEVTVDARGRILAVYADGCNFDHPCININNNSGTRVDNQGTARLTIIRQRGGMRLFKEFDAGSSSVPFSPFLDVKEAVKSNQLLWGTPDERGAPILGYRIYRGKIGEREKLLATVKSGVNTFNDRRLNKNGTYYYHVTAVNKYGESPLIAKTFVSKNK
ncbi:hypothetical protein BH10ACI1_BH10ACI1_17040 [soil metagenome]